MRSRIYLSLSLSSYVGKVCEDDENIRGRALYFEFFSFHPLPSFSFSAPYGLYRDINATCRIWGKNECYTTLESSTVFLFLYPSGTAKFDIDAFPSHPVHFSPGAL